MGEQRSESRSDSPLWTLVLSFVVLTALVGAVLAASVWNTSAVASFASEKLSGTGAGTFKHVINTIGEGTVAADPLANKYCASRCPNPIRVRRNYMQMSEGDRALYKEALAALYNSGVWYKFVMVHENGVNDPFSHGTSGFLPWHRKFLLEFENALRCIAPKFACISLPYWDWGEWQAYCNKQEGGCKSYDEVPKAMLKHFPDAKNILADFGGPGTPGVGKKTFGGTGQHNGVGCVETGPFAGWKDWEGNCLSRGVNWTMPDRANGPLTDSMELLKHITGISEYGAHGGYRASLQGMPHNNAHNYLGGHMRSMRSPMDPIFWAHHSFIDKNWALWQDCHNYELVHKPDLDKKQYHSMHRPGVEDDGIDMPMPFKITKSAFAPSKACGPTVSAFDDCRVCLGSMTSRGNKCTLQTPCWCEQRWHPQCINLCANIRCAAKCGTGGVPESLHHIEDFKREDGQEWVGGAEFGYAFDFNNLGDTPRDFAVAPNKLAVPYNYQVSDLDAAVADSVCDLSWESKALLSGALRGEQEEGSGKGKGSATAFLYTGKGNTPAQAFALAFQRAELRLRFVGVDVDSKEGKRRVAQEAMKYEEKIQCASRNKGSACKMPDGSQSPQCTWDCNGPVDLQPEVCGFHSSWMFIEKANANILMDYCKREEDLENAAAARKRLG